MNVTATIHLRGKNNILPPEYGRLTRLICSGVSCFLMFTQKLSRIEQAPD